MKARYPKKKKKKKKRRRKKQKETTSQEAAWHHQRQITALTPPQLPRCAAGSKSGREQALNACNGQDEPTPWNPHDPNSFSGASKTAILDWLTANMPRVGKLDGSQGEHTKGWESG